MNGSSAAAAAIAVIRGTSIACQWRRPKFATARKGQRFTG